MNRYNKQSSPPRLLTIGCGMATAQLLEALAAGEHPYRIDVMGDERSPASNRVLLSAVLAGDKQGSDVALLTDADLGALRPWLTFGPPSSVRVDSPLELRHAHN